MPTVDRMLQHKNDELQNRLERLYDENHEWRQRCHQFAMWSWLVKEIVEANGDAPSLHGELETVMVQMPSIDGPRRQQCKHPVSCIVTTNEGTAYCEWCADLEQGRAVVDRLVNELDEIRRQERERAAGLVHELGDRWKQVGTPEAQAIVVICGDLAARIQHQGGEE